MDKAGSALGSQGAPLTSTVPCGLHESSSHAEPPSAVMRHRAFTDSVQSLEFLSCTPHRHS